MHYLENTPVLRKRVWHTICVCSKEIYRCNNKVGNKLFSSSATSSSLPIMMSSPAGGRVPYPRE